MNLSWNTIGLWTVAVVGPALMFGLPPFVETYTLISFTVLAIMSILALSLALVWGFGGILCLGQSVFFGLGGYTYAVAVLNMGESTIPVVLGVVVAMVFAALLGYFMFYGRVSDIYLGVITIVVSLIFYHLIGGSSNTDYRIGVALLGGYNGMPALPLINVPGDLGRPLSFEGMFYLSVSALLLTYFGLRALLHSHFGRVAVSIRENPTRAELLGYDVRLHQLAVFVIGAGIAGFAGVLFANWGSFIDPNVFSIFFTVQIVMWLLVGGLGTLIGPILGCIVIQSVTTWLGATKIADTNVVLGLLFVVFVLFMPNGVIPKVLELVAPLMNRVFPALAPGAAKSKPG